MYYENEHFSPTATNDWNIETVPNQSSFRAINVYKKVNTNLYSKYVFSSSKRAKSKINFYESTHYNSPIYDAITGSTIKGHVVGSKYEDLYFKVRCSDLGIGKEGATFFYYSPGEYERHNSTMLNSDIKVTWEKKCNAAKIDLKMESEDE